MQIELDPHPEPEKKPTIPINYPQYAPPKSNLVVQHAVTDSAIWNPNATANWSLLFTPAFGSYLQYLNWKALGEEDRANTSRIWFFVSLGLYLLLPFLTLAVDHPDQITFVARGIGFWYLIIWYFAHGRSQAKFIKEHFDDSYSRKSWGQPLLLALASVVGYFIFSFALGIIFAMLRR